jgi:hypothetical protein
MKRNMGNADRVIRIVAGITIIALFLLNVITGTFAYILLAVAAIMLVTSFAGVCPLYSLLRINTRSKTSQRTTRLK